MMVERGHEERLESTAPIAPRGIRRAVRVSIGGVVQGVGFRPFVYRVAHCHGIVGWVRNDSAGVEIHAEASDQQLESFLDELRRSPPPAASIARFEVASAPLADYRSFEILGSEHGGAPTVRVAADLCLCGDCLWEMNDPADRRNGYPYINCTNCGPRYSIVRALPYDRANTTMADWPLCPACEREYRDPPDRRYHAQPVACQQCGPGYYLVGDDERLDGSEAAIRRAAELLRAGAIVAIKGIGGYHLACDANQPAALAALRDRKYRKEKPFALLARDMNEARAMVELSAAHEQWLASPARPIVLAPARRELPLVAPDSGSLGVMLPYAPLHHLLWQAGAPSPLVLTSGNRSSEPIAFRDDDAHRRLSGIADAFLIGQRPIARRVDDSVLSIRGGRPFMVRRSRGFAPASICRIPSDGPLLALGADLKNSVALVIDDQALVSQHLGDLDDYETSVAFEETVRDLLTMYDVDEDRLIVAHDAHPQFYSTRWAMRLPAERRRPVQHHLAHVASVLAEHDLLDERVIGVAFDGTGYGSDGTIWGGEFFVGSVAEGFERRAWLRPVRMPGGDAAARFPVQAAAGFLAELADLPDLTEPPFSFPPRFEQALRVAKNYVRCFLTSSVGRLFDAVAALAGFTRPTSFEGQAAIWLEHQARQVARQRPYPFADLDSRPLLQAIVADRRSGRDPREIAAAFHAALAAAAVERIHLLCEGRPIGFAALSGGVFQNDLLWELVAEGLADGGRVRPITNESVPANDGGIALGQAALAAAAG